MIGADQVAKVRELLRRKDSLVRREALDVLDTWNGRAFAPAAVDAALDAATMVYPEIPGLVAHPDEMWVRLLWQHPFNVPARDVLRIYGLAGDRVRRALLHLLALRADDEALEALVELLGDERRATQLPTPSYVTLSPVLEHPDSLRLVPALVQLSTRPGWSWEAAGALRQMEMDGRLGHAQRRAVVEGIVPVVRTLVDACDRASAVAGDRVDVARTDRERLRVLAALLAVMPGEESSLALYRMLSSADPKVAAHAAVALVARSEPVASERLELVARDAVARVDLYEGFMAEGVLTEVPELFHDKVSMAEAELVRWLSAPTELGRHPDEIEYVGPYTVVADDGPEQLHVFRFRMRSPHWSSTRGWLIGAAGRWAHSVYLAEDDCSIDTHVGQLLDSMATWDVD